MKYLIWIPVLAVLYVAASSLGVPHVIWAYEFEAASYDPLAERRYLTCTFVGPLGAVKVAASGGRCGWLYWRPRDVS